MSNSPHRDLLRRLYQVDRLSIRQLAERFNCSSTTIHRWLSEAGIARRDPGRHSQCPPLEELERELRRCKGRVSRLADHYQRDEETIRRWLRENNLTPSPRPTKVDEAKAAGLVFADVMGLSQD